MNVFLHRLLTEIENAEQNDINKILSKIALDKKGCIEFLRDLNDEINKLAATINKTSLTSDILKKIYVSVHTLKGNCSFYELTKITEAAHILEKSISELLRDNITLNDQTSAALREKADLLSSAFFENISLLDGYISFDDILSAEDIIEINYNSKCRGAWN